MPKEGEFRFPSLGRGEGMAACFLAGAAGSQSEPRVIWGSSMLPHMTLRKASPFRRPRPAYSQKSLLRRKKILQGGGRHGIVKAVDKTLSRL